MFGAWGVIGVGSRLAAEFGFGLEGLQGVIDDRAITGAVNELPHATGDGAVAADQVREPLAGFGPRLVDRTCVSVEKDATVRVVAFEDEAFIFGRSGEALEKLGGAHAQVIDEAADIALIQFCGRDAAAVGADGAVNLIFDALSDAAQDAVRVVARFQVAAEPLVFGAFLLTQRPDLDEIGDHDPSVTGV